MTTRFLIAASLLALAACGGKSDGNSAKTNGGGLPGGAAVSLRAGEWETTSQVISVDGANLSPAEVARMKTPVTTRSCMTEEEAKGIRPEKFNAFAKAYDCKQEGFVWSNGQMRGKTICEGAAGPVKMSMTMAMEGSYTPETMDIDMKTEMDVGGTKRRNETHLAGRRIGECPASEAGKAG